MSLGTREKRLLLLLAVVAAVFALSRWGRSLLPGGAGEDATTPAARLSSKGLEVVELRTDALDAPTGQYRAGGRDPFHYGPPPPPPPPTPEELAALERARREQEEARQREEAARREWESRPHPPAVDVVYLGSFGPAGRRIAVFSDGQNIYNALEGETLAGKFIVQRIGYESVDLKFVGFPDEPAKRLAAGGAK